MNNISQISILDNLLKEMQKNDKEQYKLEKMKNLMGDAGYDNGSRNKRIKEEYNVNPIIDIVHRWDKTDVFDKLKVDQKITIL